MCKTKSKVFKYAGEIWFYKILCVVGGQSILLCSSSLNWSTPVTQLFIKMKGKANNFQNYIQKEGFLILRPGP